ncbi:MAG TPA: hypothetical protein VM802_30760 [Chitinophaga sp.]|uniref:hypothetical protein n=1 Tax=Chitinophaga sp. TaxID=1869181 RepID=UPI002BF6BE45|nr:hypothetical protein [Chitinophaga sp.]HVI49287.1 hypothetical protein [Chitinophaga sp.]
MSKEEILHQQDEMLLNDPNCTININNTGPIPNYYQPTPVNMQDANNTIAQLTFADIWRLPPFRITTGTVRLDVMGVIQGGGRNWQIHINGINGPSTIASITVQGNLATASTQERQAYVQNMTKRALQQSLMSANSMDVNGPCR